VEEWGLGFRAGTVTEREDPMGDETLCWAGPGRESTFPAVAELTKKENHQTRFEFVGTSAKAGTKTGK
jgi:hypothetical protein